MSRPGRHGLGTAGRLGSFGWHGGRLGRRGLGAVLAGRREPGPARLGRFGRRGRFGRFGRRGLGVVVAGGLAAGLAGCSGGGVGGDAGPGSTVAGPPGPGPPGPGTLSPGTLGPGTLSPGTLGPGPGGSTPSGSPGSSPDLPAPGRPLSCPPAAELLAILGGPLELIPPRTPAPAEPTALSCGYAPAGQPATQTWSVRMRRFTTVPAAVGGFEMARRAQLAVETPLPPEHRPGDQAAFGRARRDVLIVRRGTDVVVIEGAARPGAELAQLTAVDEVVRARLGD